MTNLKQNWRGRQIILASLKGKLLCRKPSVQLEIKCDSNAQFSGNTSIWIHGIVLPYNASNDNVMAIVKSCYKKINVPFDQDNIDDGHGVGNTYTNENTGRKIQSIIVKFKLLKSCN